MVGHLVMARFLSGSIPRGYRVDEGLSLGEALTVRFKRHEERSRRVGVSKLEQRSLTALVGRRILKTKPEERVGTRLYGNVADVCGYRAHNYSTNVGLR